MTASRRRVGVTLSASEADRVRRAAALCGVSVAVFVRQAVVRKADLVLAHPMTGQAYRVSARLRGRVTSGSRTDEIMRLTRGD